LATTGADLPNQWRLALPLLLVVSMSCVSGSVPPEPAPVKPVVSPPPGRADPQIRIGLLVGVPTATLGGSDALIAGEPDGSRIGTIPAGQTWQVVPVGPRLVLHGAAGWISQPLDAISVWGAAPGAPVRINGRAYRGSVDLLRDSMGVTVVNRVGLESYLPGVVSAEMGRRSPSEAAALRAQAVMSRTYAMRNLGKSKARGFDLTASVDDQVYGGLSAETEEGRAAVAETRGRILTYEGRPIEAFFYSTCGGRTAAGTEVFRGAAQPYLRSIPDEAPNGRVYCSISPRYHWREDWSGEALRSTLERNLPPATGISPDQIRQVVGLRITRRTGSGRVDQLALGLGDREVRVEGPAIRRVLRPMTGGILRSTAFTLVADGDGRLVTHLSVDGMGSGHGVGFCQWGAVGRARAGQEFPEILAAYFPGTRLERRY
jgi:stage II sporulation protein D